NLQSLTQLMEWLQATSWAVFINQTKWALTTIEVIQRIAIAGVIGSIAVVDLRLLGLASTRRPFTELAREFLPYTCAAFVIAAITGSLLFISQATQYFVAPTFWGKMTIMAAAGINMFIFEFITARRAMEWDLK